MNKLMKEEFFARAAAAGGKITMERARDILRDMYSVSQLDEVLLRGLSSDVRAIMRTEDDEGIRIYHSLESEDGPAYYQTAMFDQEMYQEVINKNESRIEELIVKNQRIKGRAESEGYSVQMRFQLEVV